jgi:hypothetical protein
MNAPEKISPDDLRLTAYALGEMEAAERVAFERELARDADAQAWVEEIRATAAALEPVLAAEPGPSAQAPAPERRASVLRFPQAYFAAAGLAAACFGVYFVVQERRAAELAQREGLTVQHAATGPKAAAFAADEAAEETASRARAARAEGMTLLRLTAGEAAVPERFFSAAEAPVSSFPLRVGRGALAKVFEQLRRGLRPARGIVQVAEMINAFHYTWPEAGPGEPLVTLLEETASPWSPGHRLVRVGVKAAGPTGVVAAREARVRVEFNPARVQAWRLIGFERDDSSVGVNGLAEGETLHGGDTVTALYEILPVEIAAERAEGELLSLALHYRAPADGAERVVTRRLAGSASPFARASADLKFIASVAAYGMQLRGAELAVSVDEMARWADEGAGGDAMRGEWAGLLRATR